MKARYILILLAMLAVVGCKKKNQEPPSPSIYGVVTDRETGKPLENASVTLEDQGLTVVTGQEGAFRFDKLTGWSYTLSVEKTGYESTEKKVYLNASWAQYEVNIPLEAGGGVQMRSAEGTQLTKLDFSEEQKGNSLSFKIVNPNRKLTVSWSIEHSVPWIESIEPNSGSLHPKEQVSIVVEIDRRSLDTTVTHGVLHLKSESDSKSLTVVARNDPYYYIRSIRLMVLRRDLDSATRNDADRMCKQLNYGGFNDWRLPTMDELAAIYAEKERIGGFAKDRFYWTSTISSKYPDCPFVTINISNFNKKYCSEGVTCCIRAVRSY